MGLQDSAVSPASGDPKDSAGSLDSGDSKYSAGSLCSLDSGSSQDSAGSPDSGCPQDSGDIEMGNQSTLCVASIKRKLYSQGSQNSSPSLNPRYCIYRVHQRIRQFNKDAYTPDMVSIGPYHRPDHPNTNLEAMEKHKLKYLRAVLDRTKKTTSLEKYVEALEKLEPKARKCYSETIKLDKKQFIEMLIIDGFFILELFRKNKKIVPIDKNDPIFNSTSITARVVRDLVLLENQIPMSVLQTLFDLSKNPEPDSPTLIEMALLFFDTLIPNAWIKYPKNNSTVTHEHLVDLLRYTLSASLPTPSSISAFSTVQESLPSAMELHRSGVMFKMARPYDSLIHIKFDNGVFEIPQLTIHDHTGSFFHNLIAYEQHYYAGTPYITAYAILMYNLVDSADDVVFLRRQKIITNQLTNDHKVTAFFSNLCHGISSNGFYYLEVCDKVNDYYKLPYRQWKADLKRIWSTNAWTIISVAAAILLLLLTLWSTVIISIPYF
ncbi:hypothetical protein NE237_005847 [Protea cynaroides]|uniref:Uncharacterized protein n=1 Tax=Protea cynaroides TaxID=273540 RepID=A0A9Q0QUR9_9MAGN|nr:hypothetical protein NE237_005847 [Protea cynaroides]